MSLDRHFRSDGHGAMWIRAVLAFIVLLGVFAAREVPSHFSDAGIHSTVGADSHHDQRPRFDQGASDWNAPPAIVLVFPPTGESQHLMFTAQLLSTLRTKGFHFNRPPPIS